MAIDAQDVSDDMVLQARAALEYSDTSFGKLDLRTIAVAEKWGTDLKRAGRYEAAEALYRIVLDRRRELLGDSHPETINGRVG